MAELVELADIAVFLPAGDAPLAGLASAMATARPIIASDTPAVTEILEDGRGAWLCPPNKPLIAARLLLEALEHPEEARRRSAAAKARAREVYSVQRTLDQYARVYAAPETKTSATRDVPRLRGR